MFQYIYLQFFLIFIEVRFRRIKLFFLPLTINIKQTYWLCRLILKVIRTLSTYHDHWLFDIIKIPTWFLNHLTWCYWFLRRWTDNIGQHYFLPDIIQRTFWLQTQVKHLIVHSKFKELLSSEVFNFKPKTPRSGLGQSLILTGYSSGLT